MTKNKQAQKWIEFSLLVHSERADLVTEVLAGFFEGGLAREREFEAVFPDQLDQVKAPIRIFGYFPVEEETGFRSRIAETLASVDPDLPTPTYTPLEEKNWAVVWQDRYHPIPVGESLIIVPSWLENPDPDRTAVYIDPGMAFGSGTHPTTHLTLELLEKALRTEPPSLMIDIGCGSGILAITAAILGVREVLGVDNDPDAIQVSRENANQNQTSERCEFKEWSVTELVDDRVESTLVVANIIAPILKKLFSAGMADLVSPGGTLILSGILEDQLPGIRTHLREGGFVVSDELEKEGWYALRGEKSR